MRSPVRPCANRFLLAAACALFAIAPRLAHAQAQGTTMSYQGFLQQGGSPYNGTADLEFRLFAAPTGGVQVGDTHSEVGAIVADGLVSAALDFDNPPPAASVWNGQERWLEIRVRTPSGSANPFATLAPRRKALAAPYAVFALNASNVSLPATYASPVNFNNAGNSFSGAHSGNGAGLTALNAASIATGNLPPARMPAGGNWSLTSAMDILNQRVRINSDNNVDGLNGGMLVVGGDFQGLKMDHNTIQAVNFVQFEGTLIPTTLELNPAGGRVEIADPPFGLTGSLVVGGSGIGTNTLEVGDIDDFGELRVNGSSLVVTPGADGNVGVGAFTPLAKLHVVDFDESPTQANFTGAVTDAGVLISTSNINNTFTPGVFWHTTNNNNTKPKAGIYLRQLAAGTRMHFGTSNNFATGITNDALVIGETGRVGIGTGLSSIDASLHVAADNARVIKVDRHGSDGELLSWARDDSAMGSVTVTAGSVAYGAFTGVHYARLDQGVEFGALVSLTGDNAILGDRSQGETVYGATLTATANDPAVLGTYIGDLNGETYGHPHDLAQVAALGNGDLWVVDASASDSMDAGAGISPGDYLIASDVPGCAMKDDPARFAVGHVIARAASKVDWSQVAPDPAGRRRARISVLFGNFIRSGSPAPAAVAATDSASNSSPAVDSNEDLAARVRRLERLLMSGR